MPKYGCGVAAIRIDRCADTGLREDWHAVFTATVPPGRWFWWAVVDHIDVAEQQRTSRAHRLGYYEFIVIDAQVLRR